MTPADLRAWFADVAVAMNDVHRVSLEDGGYYHDGQAAMWLASAEAAIASAFPAGHAIRIRWSNSIGVFKNAKTRIPHAMAFEAGVGIFRAGLEILEKGRLGSLIDGIRAETVSEVLDQAESLLPKYPLPAAVLAGGALETHLLHLCQRNGLTWSGDGSISAYDAAIAQARNAGREVYSATDSKAVTGWGGKRNDAAHRPTTFKRSGDDVQLMVDGIRQFIARVP